MAYTWLTVVSAFNVTYDGDGNPLTNGYDYQPADELIKRVTDAGEGRFYANKEGNLVYESRLHREAP